MTALSALALCALVSACTNVAWQARFAPPSRIVDLERTSPFLKCHTKNGRVYVLEAWHHDADAGVVRGRGILYDSNRRQIDKGDLTVPLESIVLLETNRPREVTNWARVAVMALATAAQAAGIFACIANPKACFGSCPTFYVEDGTGMALQAEGFSRSIARVLESTDVDSLFAAHTSDRNLRVVMRNEALETHAVHSIRVLAVPRPADARVFRSGEDYWAARNFRSARTCTAPDASDCRSQVEAFDGREWRSFSDGKDLAAKETIDLTFDAPAGHHRRAIVIGARNTLLNTFLLYQTLAHMGRLAGDWIALLERGGKQLVEVASGPGRLLGDIEVLTWSGREWRPAGVFSEVGPLAREVQAVPIPDGPDEVRVRLRLNRANWRLDWVSLVQLDEKVTPQAVSPVQIERAGKEDPGALALLRAGDYLFTQPGDEYTFHFELPEGTHELFLESRGYYYEWMREPWLADENPREVRRMLTDPALAMRRLAPAFKAREHELEPIFWNSRIGPTR